MTALDVRWLTAFLDAPVDVHDGHVAFWCAVTGADLSPRRGSQGEFASLLPVDGDPHLRVQRLDGGVPRVHLDVHVPDLAAASRAAVAHGATETGDLGDVRTMLSPGGFVWCLVGASESRRPTPTGWGGHRSLVDQVCVDAPAPVYEAEEAFWAALTGWRLQETGDAYGLRALERPAGQPLRMLLQRLEEPDGPVRAHLDLATDDRDSEVARHLGLGAAVVRRTPWWTTLRDPAGLDCCVTDRDPESGVLS